MPLKDASVPMGATYAPTGGTARTLKSLGATLNEHKLWLDDGSANILRKDLYAYVKPPVVVSTAPNGLSQQRITTVFRQPILLANGKYTTNTLEIKMSYDIETSSTQISELKSAGTHQFVDADFSDLWGAGSTS